VLSFGPHATPPANPGVFVFLKSPSNNLFEAP